MFFRIILKYSCSVYFLTRKVHFSWHRKWLDFSMARYQSIKWPDHQGNNFPILAIVDGSWAVVGMPRSDKSRRTGCEMIIGLHVGLLQFSLLSPSSGRSVLRKVQSIQQCGSTESNWRGPDWESWEFYDNLWKIADWQGTKEQRNYVLQTLNELELSRQRYHSSSW